MNDPAPPLLDAAQVAFMTGGTPVQVASCNAARVPSVSRGVGCRVAADRTRVTVFVSEAQANRLLDDIRATRRVACVFDEPATHRAMQVKGEDAVVEPLGDGDVARICAYADACVVRLEAVGHDESFTRTYLATPHGDVLAVSFTPSAVFTQTPGPNAGARLAGHP